MMEGTEKVSTSLSLYKHMSKCEKTSKDGSSISATAHLIQKSPKT